MGIHRTDLPGTNTDLRRWLPPRYRMPSSRRCFGLATAMARTARMACAASPRATTGRPKSSMRWLPCSSELKDRYHPRQAILVGHSGGAAIVGDLLGQQGIAVDGALLVSCPCDLTEWRKHMQSVKGGAFWERPVRSLSPLALVDGVPASAKIWLLVGSDDQITPSAFTLAYAEALRNRNVAVNVTIASGLGHDILLEPIAMERLQEVASTLMLEGSAQLLAHRDIWRHCKNRSQSGRRRHGRTFCQLALVAIDPVRNLLAAPFRF